LSETLPGRVTAARAVRPAAKEMVTSSPPPSRSWSRKTSVAVIAPSRVLQQERSVIPKSTKPERIAENIDVFDFELAADQMTAIDGLDTGRRGGPEPEAITLEAFGRDIPEA
jgi:aryl-alcohol dehydrogenase-like predicted oxidoreductase